MNYKNIKSDKFDGTVEPIDNIVKYSPEILKKDPTNTKKYNKKEIQEIILHRKTYTVPYMGSYKDNHEEYVGSHLAIDIAVPVNTKVRNIANGVVVKIGLNKQGFGNYVVIKHNDVLINGKRQNIYSSYSHLSSIAAKLGKKVKKGKVIGYSGNSGTSSGPHLHFQIDKETAPFIPYWPYNSNETNKLGISFYQGINKGLGKNKAIKYTINPLEFVYKNISENITIDEKEVASISNIELNSAKEESKNESNDNNIDIFNKTIYRNSDKKDIEKLQKIFKLLGYYNGKIDGNYKNLEKDITRYQIDKKVIKNKYSIGSGYFGPKTRKQTKSDFDEYINKLKRSPAKIEKKETKKQNLIVKNEKEVASLGDPRTLERKSKINTNLEIFNKAIYRNSEKKDIKALQKVFKLLGYYNGKIDGNYKNLEKDITRYQIDKKVIKNKYSIGSGYFGPKTRKQTKSDFENFVEKYFRKK